MIFEEGAVGKTGEQIVEGVVEQFLLSVLAIGDIGLRASQTICHTGLVANCQTPAEHPAVTAVFVQEAVLIFELISGAFDMRSQGNFELFQVFGVDPVEPFVEGGEDFFLFITQHLFPTWGVINPVGFQIPVPDAVVGAAHRQSVTFFALAQGNFSALALHQLFLGFFIKAGVLQGNRGVIRQRH